MWQSLVATALLVAVCGVAVVVLTEKRVNSIVVGLLLVLGVSTVFLFLHSELSVLTERVLRTSDVSPGAQATYRDTERHSHDSHHHNQNKDLLAKSKRSRPSRKPSGEHTNLRKSKGDHRHNQRHHLHTEHASKTPKSTMSSKASLILPLGFIHSRILP